MDVIERIAKIINGNAIVIFMKGTPEFPQCGFSARASQALASFGREFAYVNIFEDPEIHRALPQYANWPTFPQIYIGGELIGGCDIVMELHGSGELKKMVDEAKTQSAQDAA
ncbi:MAG: Grx4 family monothiol glutaredoxin [Oceanococcaceae bacterium]